MNLQWRQSAQECAHPLHIWMHITHGGGNAGVPQDLLQGLVIAGPGQMGRHAVAQPVRGNALPESRRESAEEAADLLVPHLRTLIAPVE